MDRAQTSYVGRLQRLPSEIATHPALLFAPGVEGYRSYAFGCKSGPSTSIEHLFHELAHAAEFGGDAFEERATATGYLLRSRRIWIFDRFCEEPLTMAAIERELRTFAHQHHLQVLSGQKFRPEAYFRDCARLMRIMSDWLNVPGRSDEARTAYCAKRIASLAREIPPESTIERLKGWLDHTLVRLASEPEESVIEDRFHADGAQFDVERLQQPLSRRQALSP